MELLRVRAEVVAFRAHLPRQTPTPNPASRAHVGNPAAGRQTENFLNLLKLRLFVKVALAGPQKAAPRPKAQSYSSAGERQGVYE